MTKKKKTKHLEPRPTVFFRNYDYATGPEVDETSPGSGLYSNLDKFDSVEEFRRFKQKARTKLLQAWLEESGNKQQ